MMAFHEGIEHWQPRRDGLRASGRDPAQLRSVLRPPAPRGASGGPRMELSAVGGSTGRFAPSGRELGAPIRAGRFWRLERRRADGASVAIERGRSHPRGEGVARQSVRLRSCRSPLGWSPSFVVPAPAPGHNPSRAAVPAVVPADGISSAQTPSSDCFCRSAAAGRTQKNSGDWPKIPPSTCGRWMRFTSSNTAAAAGCGCHRRFSIPSASMRRPASPSATSGPFESATASSAARHLSGTLMPRRAGTSSATFIGSVPLLAAAWSLSPTMRNTIMPPCTQSGAAFMSLDSTFTSCRPTVRNSIPSNESGNCFGASVFTTGTSPRSSNFPRLWMPSLLSGNAPTWSSSGSVPCDAMRINLRRGV